MRRVAAELGITAMPLYGYFENKEALLSAMIAEAFPGVSGEVDLDAPWQDQLAEVMRQLRAALTRHPGALDLLLSRAAPELDPIRETLIRILRTAGFDAEQSVSHLIMLVSYAIGSVVISYRRGDPAAELNRIRELAPSRYPQLRASAAEYARRGSTETYEQPLQLLISALTLTTDRMSGRDTGAQDDRASGAGLPDDRG